MNEISRMLRVARERAGLTLEEISARTKIKLVLLQAIEHGEFERLPGEFFTRAFLRTYAREVHLSPEEVVREYDRMHRVADVAPNDTPALDTGTAPASATQRPASESFPFLTGLMAPIAWPLALIALLLLVVIPFSMRRGAAVTNEPGAVGTAGTAAASQPEQLDPASRAVPEKLTIEIRPSAVVWVRAAADGKRALYRLMQPGERVTIEATRELTLRVGNAGVFEYSLNGAPGRPLGAAGQVSEARITLENRGAFVADAQRR